MARVMAAFRDRVTWRLWPAGSDYAGPREAELAAAGLLEADAGGEDYSGLTNQQLRELCAERELDVPAKATKAALLEALGA